MTCFKPIYLRHLATKDNPNGLEVPCGKCLACKIARSREWALRMIHEYDSWDRAVFITLTYDDEHLNYKNGFIQPTIDSKDLQKYFKRLRKTLATAKRKISYYACGEYGEKTERPHYHAIIFGIGIEEHLLEKNGNVSKGICKDLWGKGNVHMGLVTYDSARYVSQYIDKKYSGELKRKVYTSTGRQCPFQLVSQGFGLRFAMKNKILFDENLYTTIRGKIVGLPRYYKKKLNIDPKRLGAYTKLKNEADYIKFLNILHASKIDIDNENLKKIIVDTHEQSKTTLESKTKLFNSRHKNI